jgi:hypothetical protein
MEKVDQSTISPQVPPPVIGSSPPTPGEALAFSVGVGDSSGVDEETRAAVAELIATNRKLRRAVKERDAERSALRAEAEKLKKDLSDALASQKQQAEDLLVVRFFFFM